MVNERARMGGRFSVRRAAGRPAIAFIGRRADGSAATSIRSSAQAMAAGLYTNLITAGVLLTREHIERPGGDRSRPLSSFRSRMSFPTTPTAYPGTKAASRASAMSRKWARELGSASPFNAPMHRQNLDHLPEITTSRSKLARNGIEVAHIQYLRLGGAESRRADSDAREISPKAVKIVDAAKARLCRRVKFRLCHHDHYATLPKACMGGFGRNPSWWSRLRARAALSCRSDPSRPRLRQCARRPLADIWRRGAAFEAFRAQVG